MKGNLKFNSSIGRLFFIAVLILLCGSIALVQSKTVAIAAQDQELSVIELLKLPGKVIGEGTNTKAVGKYRLVSYRAEEVVLHRDVGVEIGGKKVRVNKAFRLTITGGPFSVRVLPPVIWVDDIAVGYGVENEDLDAITAVTYDASLLREGASIFLSYGDKSDKGDRVELPEKFKFKKEDNK